MTTTDTPAPTAPGSSTGATPDGATGQRSGSSSRGRAGTTAGTAPGREVGGAAAPVAGAGWLVAGVVAGPVFVGSGLTQAFTREGFDLRRNALSQLALGDLWWLQVATFLVTGVLLLAGAVGLRRAGAGVWLPRAIGAYGVGMLIAGVFRTDPSFGYPAGAPAGMPESLSRHGILHAVGFYLAMTAWTAAAAVAATRFARRGERAWATGVALAPVAAVLVFTLPGLGPVSVRIAIAATLQFALMSALCAELVSRTDRPWLSRGGRELVRGARR